MKHNKILIFSILSIFSASFLFCAGTAKQQAAGKAEKEDQSTYASAEKAENKENNAQIVEDFDPTFLRNENFDIKESAKAGAAGAASIDEILKGGNDVDTLQTGQVSGYRVQLLSTRDGSEARAVRNEALLAFEENVYLSFDDPYYKIRVGDCLSRYDADILQEKANTKGFTQAWVVRTNILPHSGKDEEHAALPAKK
jgi:hypothetical protein